MLGRRSSGIWKRTRTSLPSGSGDGRLDQHAAGRDVAARPRRTPPKSSLETATSKTFVKRMLVRWSPRLRDRHVDDCKQRSRRKANILHVLRVGDGKRAMKTLVTGASGFIGSAVVRASCSAAKREVRCRNTSSRRPIASNLAGLASRDRRGRRQRSRRRRPRARGLRDVTLPPRRDLQALDARSVAASTRSTSRASKTVCFAAMKAKLKKVVYTKTLDRRDRRARDGQPSDETTPFNLWDESNAYIRSKWLSERDALRFAAEGLPLVAVNPAFPFGERDIAPTPTGTFVLRALEEGECPAGWRAASTSSTSMIVAAVRTSSPRRRARSASVTSPAATTSPYTATSSTRSSARSPA